eukprot:746250-Hanusia_phi.AAC.1
MNDSAPQVPYQLTLWRSWRPLSLGFFNLLRTSCAKPFSFFSEVPKARHDRMTRVPAGGATDSASARRTSKQVHQRFDQGRGQVEQGKSAARRIIRAHIINPCRSQSRLPPRITIKSPVVSAKADCHRDVSIGRFKSGNSGRLKVPR